jgi:ribonuclease HI
MKIEAWTDGSGPPPVKKGEKCIGIAAWAAIVKLHDSPFVQELTGGEPMSTTSRMEMTAVLMVLTHFKQPCEFVIYCDSALVVNCFRRGWIASWRKKGWINSKQEPVANRDLWEALDAEVQRHASVEFVKVKGHAGVEYNEMCDRIARQTRDSLEHADWI